jgi:transposase
MGRYTIEFKEEAIALALKSHRSHQEIALDLGINPSTFRNWVSEATMIDKHSSTNDTKKSHAELEAELRAMRKELAFRQEEIEILKKAAAYFAKNLK